MQNVKVPYLTSCPVMGRNGTCMVPNQTGPFNLGFEGLTSGHQPALSAPSQADPCPLTRVVYYVSYLVAAVRTTERAPAT